MSRILVVIGVVAGLASAGAARAHSPLAPPPKQQAPPADPPPYEAPLQTDPPPHAAPPPHQQVPPHEVPPREVPLHEEAAPLEEVPPSETPARPAGPGRDLVLAGGISLAGGYLLGLIPLIASVCDDDDTQAECDRSEAFGESLDYHPAWALIPVAGPFVILSETESTGASIFFGIVGAAQALGVVLVVVGATLPDDVQLYEEEAGFRIETGGVSMISDGQELVPTFTVGGTF